MNDVATRPTQSAAAPVLRLSGLSRRYKSGESELTVLDGVALDIAPGEIVGLIGPSGSGKSSLLHAAGMLERPNAGEVLIAGADGWSMSDEDRTEIRRNKIGFVYQFHHLLPEFTASENVALPQMIAGLERKEATKRANELLAFLGLSERLNHRPSELSGGEQQRVAIARAVANAPKLLLADEPTGNLDPKTADHVFGTLSKLVEATQLAAIIATHNLDLASRMTRRVTLREGKVVELE
jgi:lipoprotein-releasing system ATP-binding protein